MVAFNPFTVNVGRALARLNKPVLIIHGDADDLVNVRHAERNHRLAGGKKHLEIVAESSHSETRWLDPERYMSLLRSFIEDLVSDRIDTH
jgi:pimeloyl-ACP methyl ester carboxylesterase